MPKSLLAIPLTLFRHEHQLAYARQMRRRPTASERLLWSRLRQRTVLGFRTKRQPVVGPYITDVLVPAVRLVIEVDGSAHFGRELADARRQADLELLGYSVFRVSAEDVMRDVGSVVRSIAATVALLRAA